MTQTPQGQPPSAIDLIMQDHREVEQLFDQAQQTSDPEQFQQIVSTAIAELVRHSVAEEQHLYPAFREFLDDGDELADHEIAEHAEAEQTMKEIEQYDAADPKLRERFNALVDEVIHHVQEEEADALSRLQDACTEEQLRKLGAKIERAKSIAPTRPHPSAPDTPPMNKLLAPGCRTGGPSARCGHRAK